MVMLEMIGTTFANVTGEPLVKAAKTEAQMILDAHNKVRKAAKAVAMNKLVSPFCDFMSSSERYD